VKYGTTELDPLKEIGVAWENEKRPVSAINLRQHPPSEETENKSERDAPRKAIRGGMGWKSGNPETDKESPEAKKAHRGLSCESKPVKGRKKGETKDRSSRVTTG